MDALGVDYLKEYVDWSKQQQVKGRDYSPEYFHEQKRVERIIQVLNDIFDVDAGLIEHNFEEEDVEWIKSQGTTEVSVDRTV